MNTWDSTRPLRGVLAVTGKLFKKTYSGSGSSVRRFPFCCTLSCWGLILAVSLLMVSGCGKYKEELESAKQQIEKLTSDNKRLTEDAASLNQEKSRLSDDLNALSDKNTRMQGELQDLNKAKAALSAENKDIKKKSIVADEEIASLKREKAQLAAEIEELKKRLAEIASPPKLPAAVSPEVGPGTAKQREESSPCDAVIAFMKASEAVVRQQKGTERTRSLEQVKEQYAPRMKGAPEKAIKAAEDWVIEGTKFWDQSSDDAVFRLLQLRNKVLEACGKSPGGTGFR